jgi:hypothetical protein
MCVRGPQLVFARRITVPHSLLYRNQERELASEMVPRLMS